jgi:hypothetical protein
MKSKDMRLLNRREFNGLCVALGSFASPTGAAGLDAAAGAASTRAGRTAKFRDGSVVPALGQGSAGLGKGKHPQAVEEEAVRTGLSLRMTLIDTAEVYGSEETYAKDPGSPILRAYTRTAVTYITIGQRFAWRLRLLETPNLGVHQTGSSSLAIVGPRDGLYGH